MLCFFAPFNTIFKEEMEQNPKFWEAFENKCMLEDMVCNSFTNMIFKDLFLRFYDII